ncbi:MAG: DUF1493 family protein [Flavobacteriales bacterium]|nr:DUF1493 family protein [Flavobacteriales bacterium]
MHSTMQEAQINHEVLNDLLSEQIGAARDMIKMDTDIEADLSCTGDDFHELMDTYSKQFNVDMSEYIWYFHTQEEGFNIGSMLFAPPNERVERIPVTPVMLIKFAEQGNGTWPIPIIDFRNTGSTWLSIRCCSCLYYAG